MPINKPSGRPCIERLQARERGSILERLCCTSQTCVLTHTGRPCFLPSRRFYYWPLLQFVGKSDIVDHAHSAGNIMKECQHLAMIARSKLSEKCQRVSVYLHFHLARQ